MEHSIYSFLCLLGATFILLELASYFLSFYRRRVWIGRKVIEKEMTVANIFSNKESNPHHVIEFQDAEQNKYFVAADKAFELNQSYTVRIERRSFYRYKSVFGTFTKYETDEQGNKILRNTDRLVS